MSKTRQSSVRPDPPAPYRFSWISHKRRRGRRVLLCALVVVSLGAGCIHAPRATVQLSEIVGTQISEMQRSHEAFVQLYYTERRNNIDRFLKEKWIPSFLAKAAVNEEFRAQLDVAYQTGSLDPSDIRVTLGGEAQELPEDVRAALLEGVAKAIEGERAKMGQVLIDFGNEAVRQIELQRAAMVSGLDEQEAMVLEELRGGYADLMRAQSSVHGFLASAVKVEEERSEILRKTGLLEQQTKFLNAAIRTSDAAEKALTTAADGEAAVAEFLRVLKAGKVSLEAIKEGRGPAAAPATAGDQEASNDPGVDPEP